MGIVVTNEMRRNDRRKEYITLGHHKKITKLINPFFILYTNWILKKIDNNSQFYH